MRAAGAVLDNDRLDPVMGLPGDRLERACEQPWTAALRANDKTDKRLGFDICHLAKGFFGVMRMRPPYYSSFAATRNISENARKI